MTKGKVDRYILTIIFQDGTRAQHTGKTLRELKDYRDLAHDDFVIGLRIGDRVSGKYIYHKGEELPKTYWQ